MKTHALSFLCLCYHDSLASLMANGSKMAFALVTVLITVFLMSEDNTLKHFVM